MCYVQFHQQSFNDTAMPETICGELEIWFVHTMLILNVIHLVYAFAVYNSHTQCLPIYFKMNLLHCIIIAPINVRTWDIFWLKTTCPGT